MIIEAENARLREELARSSERSVQVELDTWVETINNEKDKNAHLWRERALAAETRLAKSVELTCSKVGCPLGGAKLTVLPDDVSKPAETKI